LAIKHLTGSYFDRSRVADGLRGGWEVVLADAGESDGHTDEKGAEESCRHDDDVVLSGVLFLRDVMV
jgi:hypothetical protein